MRPRFTDVNFGQPFHTAKQRKKSSCFRKMTRAATPIVFAKHSDARITQEFCGRGGCRVPKLDFSPTTAGRITHPFTFRSFRHVQSITTSQFGPLHSDVNPEGRQEHPSEKKVHTYPHAAVLNLQNSTVHQLPQRLCCVFRRLFFFDQLQTRARPKLKGHNGFDMSTFTVAPVPSLDQLEASSPLGYAWDYISKGWDGFTCSLLRPWRRSLPAAVPPTHGQGSQR